MKRPLPRDTFAHDFDSELAAALRASVPTTVRPYLTTEVSRHIAHEIVRNLQQVDVVLVSKASHEALRAIAARAWTEGPT